MPTTENGYHVFEDSRGEQKFVQLSGMKDKQGSVTFELLTTEGFYLGPLTFEMDLKRPAKYTGKEVALLYWDHSSYHFLKKHDLIEADPVAKYSHEGIAINIHPLTNKGRYQASLLPDASEKMKNTYYIVDTKSEERVPEIRSLYVNRNETIKEKEHLLRKDQKFVLALEFILEESRKEHQQNKQEALEKPAEMEME